MNVVRKLKPAPVNGTDLLDVLDCRLRELAARRDAITETIIGLEKSTAGRAVDVSADLAEALLTGEKFVASRDTASRLARGAQND